ncbi:MAG: hypothetical protein IIY88_06300, partial [Eubacterium sp.]|nr:hypothetical protein [Eubacterium sp.]
MANKESINRYIVVSKDETIRGIDKCPLIMQASALTYDRVEDKALAQLKFKNLGSQPVKAVFIDVKCYGADNTNLPDVNN